MTTALMGPWVRAISAPDSAGRHLGRILGSHYTRFDALAPMTDEALQRLIRGVQKDKPEQLANAIDLADELYVDFAERLNPLLRHLTHRNATISAVVGPGLEGVPSWERTILCRRTHEIERDEYVVTKRKREYENNENIVLRWAVESIWRGLDSLGRGGTSLPPRLEQVFTRCKAASSHAFLGTIQPRKPTPGEIKSARHQRNHAYRMASRVAEQRLLLEGNTVENRLARTYSLLNSQWISPTDPDDIFELYVLVMVLDVLEKELGLGAPVRYGLALPSRRFVAEFEGGWKVHYDLSVSKELEISSRYSMIRAQYEGMTESSRRPDIFISRKLPDGRHDLFIVEVKRSEDGKYMNDSIYKAFGYLHDLGDAWGGDFSKARLALIFPQNISSKKNAFVNENGVVLVGWSDRRALASAVASGLDMQYLSQVIP